MPKHHPPIDRYISRFDDAHQGHGWIVRIQPGKRRGGGQTRRFADSKHGGKAKALHAARKFRNRVHGPQRPRWVKSKAQPNSKTKVLGVYRLIGMKSQYYKDRRYLYPYDDIIGSYTDARGKQRCKRFSVAKHGLKNATALAKAWRAKHINTY